MAPGMFHVVEQLVSDAEARTGAALALHCCRLVLCTQQHSRPLHNSNPHPPTRIRLTQPGLVESADMTPVLARGYW